MINWAWERSQIAAAAAIHRVDPDYIEAIRVAENGAPGREFGVLDQGADTYEAQLRIACRSVAHRLAECPFNPLTWSDGKSRYKAEFVKWFAGKWAPPGAGNDPDNLNPAWFRNAWSAYEVRIQGT